ncbi:MAG: hypothetical protein KGK16_12630 [Bradyrhizobium sp.]|nr:hypothetical protein [Bradyrhizobium sp.]
MSFVCGLAGILLFTTLAPVAQVVARRAGSPIAPVAILAMAAIVSHAASIALGVMTVEHFRYWNAASVFGFGVMLYVFAFGAVYKSVSLEILLDLAQRPEAAAPLAEIIQRKVPEIFRGRTDILVSGGQVERADSRFVVTPSGCTTVSRIGALRRAFAIGDTGLYDFAVPFEMAEKTTNS